MSKHDYTEVAHTWADANHYAPSSRHRRRIILELVKPLDYDSYIDVGCAQGYLIEGIKKLRPSKGAGCDVSEIVIAENKQKMPDIDFFTADISKRDAQLPDVKYDLVMSSEVIEHIEDYETAVYNLCRLSKKYVLITTPVGKLYDIDKSLGHFQFPSKEKLCSILKSNGFNLLLVSEWGFPFYVCYKKLIDVVGADKIYSAYTKKYSPFQKFTASCLYTLFFANDLFSKGCQLVLLAERKNV